MSRLRLPVLLHASALAMLLLSGVASAEECPIPPKAAPQLSQIDPAVRLSFLRSALDTDGKLVSRWRWGWVSGFGFLAAYNFAGGFATGPALTTHTADFVGATEAVVSIIPLLANPPHVAKDARTFDAQVDAPSADRCALIHEGERLIEADAENEAFAAGWVTQVLNVVLNGVVFAVVGAKYGGNEAGDWTRLGSAGVIAGLGFILGETMILTQPTNLAKRLKEYESGSIQAPPPALGFTIHAAGPGVAGTF